jgi:hypothetical protein
VTHPRGLREGTTTTADVLAALAGEIELHEDLARLGLDRVDVDPVVERLLRRRLKRSPRGRH